MKRILKAVVTGLVCGLLMGFSGPVLAGSTHIAIVRTPPPQQPGECFVLWRGGKKVGSRHRMEVYIGDEIRVEKGKSVMLECRNGTTRKLSENFIVAVPPAPIRTENRFESVPAYAPRSPDYPRFCFPLPDKIFNLFPWPVNGTTAMAGEPMLFQWYKLQGPCKPCESVTLVITEKGNKKTSQKIPMKAGELLPVNSLEPGQHYEWFVEKAGKRVSDVYSFRVLDRESSAEIRAQLDRIGKISAKEPPEFAQARYLQFISDSNPDWDLYADSLRYWKALSEKAVVTENMLEPLYRHCWPD